MEKPQKASAVPVCRCKDVGDRTCVALILQQLPWWLSICFSAQFKVLLSTFKAVHGLDVVYLKARALNLELGGSTMTPPISVTIGGNEVIGKSAGH